LHGRWIAGSVARIDVLCWPEVRHGHDRTSRSRRRCRKERQLPQDIEDASAEITRLLKLTNTTSADRTREKRAVQHDLQTRPDDATAIRESDVIGYGSNCQWSH